MSNKFYLLLLICIIFSFSNASGQDRRRRDSNGDIMEDVTDYGLLGGVNSSVITNVDKIIISEPYFLNGINNYKLIDKHIYGPTLGAFFNHHIHLDDTDDGIFYVYGEGVYSGTGTQLNFSNKYDYFYTIKYNYQFANLLLLIGGKLDGVNVGIGPEFGFNVAPKNILFTSYGPGRLDAFGTDLAQQQQLRNDLFGKNNFGLVGSLGYQILSFADIELRYHVGLKNIIEVQPNSYNWTQQTNHMNSAQIVLKFYISERNRLKDQY